MKILKIWIVIFASVLLSGCPGDGDGVDPSPSPVGGVGGAAAVPYTVSGLVTGAASGTTSVTLTPAAGASTSVNVDASGAYSFPLPPVGNYTITPGNSNNSFSPSFSTISVDATTTGRYGINFSAITGYSISGTVSGSILKGVTILLYGSGSGAPISTVTDNYGYYHFGGISNGPYTVIPSFPGYTFAPANSVITIADANTSGLNYSATAGGTTTTTTATLSGTISGAVKQNVLMELYSTSSSVPTSTFTDVNGFYMFTGLSNGTYTVIPALSGFSFSPNNSNVTITGANITANNFVASAGTAITTNNKLSGTVSGAISQGVTIILHTPSGQLSAVTDANGYYEFTGLSNGNYTAVPTLSGFTFSPASNVLTINSADIAGNNYSATGVPTTLTHSLTGTITGEVVAGQTLYLYGTASGSVVTNANGYYEFTGLSDGVYTIIPAMPSTVFSPGNLIVSMAGAISTGNDFTDVLTLHSISGTIPGVAGATLLITGASTATTTTDSLGNYTLTGLVNGAYTITPSLTQYTFNPTTIGVTLAGASLTGVNFTPTYIPIPKYTISGHITNRKGLANNVITLSGAAAATTVTDVNGYYQFGPLLGGVYTVTPSSIYPNVIYDPGSTTINLQGDAVADFTGFDTINVSVTTNQQNYDVKTALIAAGWDGVTKIYATITISSAANIYATSTANYGMYIQGIFPATSTVTLINYGYIMGMGGYGGQGSYTLYGIAPGTGGPGGPALYINAATTVRIYNYGVIAGGGGGGGGMMYNYLPYIGDNGGWGAGVNGSRVGLPNGGGGRGGDAGQWGGSGTSNWGGAPGVGGPPGAATTGSTNATWYVLGTILGTQN